MARREYAGAAQKAYLTAALGGTTGDLTIQCDNLTNWPTGSVGNFYIVIDRNLASEEKILCSSRAGNVLTVFSNGGATGRGADGTTLTAHSNNAAVEHVFTATDADEANSHVNTNALHIQSNQEAVTICTSTTRPGAPASGDLILETDTNELRAYLGGAWVLVVGSGAQGGGTDQVFFENDLTIDTNYTVTSNKNAGTFGPVTISSGITVTIPSGSTWTVV